MTIQKSIYVAFGFALCMFLQDGQEKKQGKGKRGDKEAQSSYEPRTKPGVGQEFLKKFVGDWNVEKTIHGRSGNVNKSTGECKQTMVHDGRFLESQFTFKTRNGTTTGTGIIGYESDSGIFTSNWVDSRSTKMSIRQSKGKFDGKSIVLFSASLGDGKKGSNESRTETHLEDNDQKLIHRAYILDAQNQEKLFMELVMTKKSS